MKNAKLAAYSGVVSALSVILLFIGSISFSLGYVMPIVSGLLMIFLIESVSYKSAFISYISTCVLSLLLLNDKETALFYVLFFGYYPILRTYLCKIKPIIVRIILKLIIFNISMLSVQLFLIYLFNIPFDNTYGKIGIILFALALNLIFIMYDITYDKLIIIYDRKIKQKLSKIIK